jgi:Abnormal spindle-like microcephaly-assoc'd, ASPM-SPD-2-Hydin
MMAMRSFPLVSGLLCCLALAPAWAQKLHCEPCWHGFGNVQIGSSSSYSFRLSNTGSKTLQITSKSKQGSEFSFGKFPLPVNLQPGASVELPVIFKPIAKGYSTGVFELVSTAKYSILTMNVMGFVEVTMNSKLGVSPATLSFGNVTVGSSASLEATLTASNAAVTISSDGSTSSEFLLALNLPVTIPAGQSIQVTVQFKPNASGTASGKAGFISNASDSPTVELLTGTGVAPFSHYVDLSWDSGGGAARGIQRVPRHCLWWSVHDDQHFAGFFDQLHRLYGCLWDDLLLRDHRGERPRSGKRLLKYRGGSDPEPLTGETHPLLPGCCENRPPRPPP